MQFRIRGADRDSGVTTERVIEARDEAAARVQASGSGLMVETLTALDLNVGLAYAVRVLTTVVDNGQDGAAVIQSQLEQMLNRMAQEGWDFVSVQTVPALTRAGHGRGGRISGEDIAADVSLAVFRRGGSPPTA
jgi:hypothetical protein